jgi:hypothetical protein
MNTITAATLIEATALLLEVASGEAETCARKPLVRIGSLLRKAAEQGTESMAKLATAGQFMIDYAQGLALFGDANKAMADIAEFAAGVAVA